MNVHFKNRVFVVSALLGLTSLALAGVPNRIVYQGRLFKSGVAVTGPKAVRLALVNPAGGAELDSEVFDIALPATGEFTIVWETPQLDPNIDWVNTTPELRVKVDTEDLLPAEQLGVSPYSFVTRRVDVGGVNTAALQDGAVTDVKISSVSAAKVWLPGTGSLLTVWQSTVAGQTDKIDSTKIYGTIPTVPSAHAASHVGTDPIVGLGAAQVAGTAIVGSKSTPQTIQATGNVVPLAIKPNPTVAAGTLNALEVFDTVPSTSMFIRGDGLTYFKNNVGVGTASPTEKLEVAGGNLKVSGGIAATTISASSATLAAASVTGAATAGALQVTGATNLATVSGNVGIGTTSPVAKLDVNGPINFTSQKTCRITAPGLWTFTVVVPTGWSSTTCSQLMTSNQGTIWMLGCMFSNGYSYGAHNGGIPSPNCGW